MVWGSWGNMPNFALQLSEKWGGDMFLTFKAVLALQQSCESGPSKPTESLVHCHVWEISSSPSCHKLTIVQVGLASWCH